jgi:hypothetical protein
VSTGQHADDDLHSFTANDDHQAPADDKEELAGSWQAPTEELRRRPFEPAALVFPPRQRGIESWLLAWFRRFPLRRLTLVLARPPDFVPAVAYGWGCADGG